MVKLKVFHYLPRPRQGVEDICGVQTCWRETIKKWRMKALPDSFARAIWRRKICLKVPSPDCSDKMQSNVNFVRHCFLLPHLGIRARSRRKTQILRARPWLCAGLRQTQQQRSRSRQQLQVHVPLDPCTKAPENPCNSAMRCGSACNACQQKSPPGASKAEAAAAPTSTERDDARRGDNGRGRRHQDSRSPTQGRPCTYRESSIDCPSVIY